MLLQLIDVVKVEGAARAISGAITKVVAVAGVTGVARATVEPLEFGIKVKCHCLVSGAAGVVPEVVAGVVTVVAGAAGVTARLLASTPAPPPDCSCTSSSLLCLLRFLELGLLAQA